MDQGRLSLPFASLSDGEKCFFICAVVIAADKAYGPVFCFWDEPDNYLSLSEVGQFVMALRQSFQNRGQLLTTSHNPEAMRKYSDGADLARDCREDTTILWSHELLKHNADELERMAPILKPILFGS